MNAGREVLNGMALFAGAGGLELGLHLAIGDAYRTVVYVEREAYAAATLVGRMEDKALDPAPVWDDVATFDGRPWRGVVDLISGGFPCQDISSAGRQEGIVKGNRSGLWFEYSRIIGEVGPRLVFVENVSALTLRGLDIVLGTLADHGFDAEWLCLGAGDIGAPHQRDRIFILAHASGAGHQARDHEPIGSKEGAALSGVDRIEMADPVRLSGWERSGRERVFDGDSEVAHAKDDLGRRGERREEKRTWTDGGGRWRSSVFGADLGDAERGGREGGDVRGPAAKDPWAGRLPIFPPGPSDAEAWRGILEIDPSLEPAVCGMADGVAHRVERLRLCGNGVVPIVAAVAFKALAGRLGIVT